MTLRGRYPNDLVDCSVEEVVTLFTFVADTEDDEKEDDDVQRDDVNGVFAEFERWTDKNAMRLMEVDGWKEKVVEWIYEESIDGRKIHETPNKNLTKTMRSKLNPNDAKSAKKLNGPCGRMLNLCRKINVFQLFEAVMNSNIQQQGARRPNVLRDCSVDAVVTLLTFPTAPDIVVGHDAVGVFRRIENEGGILLDNLSKIDKWKDKVVDWVRDNEIDGQKLKDMDREQLIMEMRSVLVDDNMSNENGAVKQDGGDVGRSCEGILQCIEKIWVRRVLRAANTEKTNDH